MAYRVTARAEHPHGRVRVRIYRDGVLLLTEARRWSPRAAKAWGRRHAHGLAAAERRSRARTAAGWFS